MLTLILAEKRDQAERIAEALGVFDRQTIKGEFESVDFWSDDEIMVVPAKGHLIQPKVKGLHRLRPLSELPSFEYEWDIAGTNRGSPTKKKNKERLEFIEKVSKDCDSFVVATDWDREGEVIGYNIMKYIGLTIDDYERMYFSSLETNEIINSYENRSRVKEDLLGKGLARNLDDPLTGLNLSKAMTYLFKKEYNTGITQAIGCGRVKLPILQDICDFTGTEIIEKPEIEVIEKEDNYVHYLDLGSEYLNITTMENENFEIVKTHLLDVEVLDKEEEQSEPLPNTDTILEDLSTIGASNLMSQLEGMYLKGLITYPRTDAEDISSTLLEDLVKICPDRTDKQIDNYPTGYRVEKGNKEPITLTRTGMKQYLNKNMNIAEEFIAGYLYQKFLKSTIDPLTYSITYGNFEHEKIDGTSYTEYLRITKNVDNSEICIDEFKSWIEREVELEVGEYNVISMKKVDEVKYTVERPAWSLDMTHFSDDKIIERMRMLGLGTKSTRSYYPDDLRYFNYISSANLPTQLGEKVSGLSKGIGLTSERTIEIEEKIEGIKDLDDVKRVEQGTKDFVRNLIGNLDIFIDNFGDLNPTCPEGHRAKFKNFQGIDGSTMLGIVCDECDKFYSC